MGGAPRRRRPPPGGPLAGVAGPALSSGAPENDAAANESQAHLVAGVAAAAAPAARGRGAPQSSKAAGGPLSLNDWEFVAAGGARSGGGSRVRDPATGRYTFKTFRQQLQQLLQQEPPSGGPQLSALDLLELQKRGERQRWKRLRGEDGEPQEETLRKRIETEESNFPRLVSHILQSVEARGPARQLLVQLSSAAPSLALLLLQQQHIFKELLQHLGNEDTYAVVLQLLPALAKDLRWRFLENFESLIEALRCLLFALEDRQDAEGVKRLFDCLTHVCRYLHKYLVANFEDFLDILLPLLLHLRPVASAAKRTHPDEDEQQQQQHQQQLPQQQQQEHPGRKRRQLEPQEPQQATSDTSRLVSYQKRQQQQQQQQQRERRRQQRPAAEAKACSSSLLAARAVATVLRRACGEEETFYGCVSAVVQRFTSLPVDHLSPFAACAAQLFVDCIRGVEGGGWSRSFEGLACFLISSVLLRQPFRLPLSRAVVEPPPLKAHDINSSSSCSSSNSSSSNISKVYMAHVECLRIFFELARLHAASMETPAAVALQSLTLRFLTAAAHAALKEVLQQQQQQQQEEEGDERELSVRDLCLFKSSVSPYFSLHPFVPLTRSPFFALEEQQESPSSERAATATPAAAATATATAAAGDAQGRRSAPPPPLVVGCCCLADAAASWFAGTPRSPGSFDSYVERLLEALLPLCKTETSAAPSFEGQQQQQQQLLMLPLLLQPLLPNGPLAANTTTEAAASLLLLCSVVRLCVCAWRSLPLSYAHAVSLTGNPMQQLLLSLLSLQHQQQQQQQQQISSMGEWRRLMQIERAVEVCCSGLRMLLLSPAPVEGFASMCLRPAFEFLGGQRRLVDCGMLREEETLGGEETPQLLLAEAGSWRLAASSSLFATLMKAFGGKGTAAAAGAAAGATAPAALRLLLLKHIEGLLMGTRLQLQRLEASVRSFLCAARQQQQQQQQQQADPKTHGDACAERMRWGLAKALAGLQWLWELQGSGLLQRDTQGDTSSRLEVSGDAAREAQELQQQQQMLLCLLVETVLVLPLTEKRHRLVRSGIVLLLSRLVATFFSLPCLFVCRDGEHRIFCPLPPVSFVESCATQLGEAAAACSSRLPVSAAAAAAVGDLQRCCCYGDTEGDCGPLMRLSPDELEETRRRLIASAAVEADGSGAAEKRWLDCFVSLLVASAVSSPDAQGDTSAREVVSSLVSSPSLLQALYLARLAVKKQHQQHSQQTQQQQQQQQERQQQRGLYLMVVKVLLPNLSSGSAELRLWSLRFIGSCDPWLLLSSPDCCGAACSSACVHFVYTAARGVTETLVRGLLQRLEALEALRVDLETERQKIQLLHLCANEICHLQERLSAPEAAAAPLAEGSPSGEGLLLLLQLAYRVLLAGLSVKFATVWPEVVEALCGCLEAFQKCDSTKREAGFTEGGSKGRQASSLQPQQQQRNAALEFVWRLVVTETHRALRQLESTSQQQQQQQQAGRRRNAPGRDSLDSAVGATAAEAVGDSREWVEEAWKAACANEAPSADEETTPLERHTHLLRILQRFAAQWGKDAFPTSKKQQQQQQQQDALGAADGLSFEASRGEQGERVLSLMPRQRCAAANLRFLLTYGLRLADQLTGVSDEGLEAAVESDPLAPAPAAQTLHASSSSSSRSSGQQKGLRGSCPAFEGRVSLIPRTHDVLRAVLAHGEVRLAGVGDRLLGHASEETRGQAGQQRHLDQEELTELWSAFLSGCCQRLISVRDPSLQSLVLKVLLLCRELQPVLRSYVPVLEEALQAKGGAPAALLRLVVGKEEAEGHLLLPATAEATAATAGGSSKDGAVLLLPEHRAFVLPLIVRVLLSKTQVKMGRSPGAVLASRRRIFGLLSSLEDTETAQVLAVLTHRLLQLTARPPCLSASSPEETEQQQQQTDRLLLEGVDKERALVRFIGWHRRRAEVSSGNSTHADEDAPFEVVLSPELLLPRAAASLHGLLKSLLQLLQQQRHSLRHAAPFLVFLFAEVLQRLVPRRGSASDLEEQEEETIPAECKGDTAGDQQDAALRNRLPSAEEEQQIQGSGEEGVVVSAAAGSALGVVGAASSSSPHRKHCVRIAIDALQLVFVSFPDMAAAWKPLLSPAAASLQLLLAAAVETGSAGHAGDTKKQEKSPAVVRFVSSWALHAEYFDFFEDVMPEALPTLLGALGSVPLLRHLQRSRRSTTPLVEAVVSTALLLSFGGRTQQQQEEELRLIRREFNAVKQVNKRRKRTQQGYHSSSSSDDSGGEEKSDKRGGFFEEDKYKSLQAFREAQEALHRQQQERQSLGMRVLLPHTSLLLQSLEALLEARRGCDFAQLSSSSPEPADPPVDPNSGGDISAQMQRRHLGGRQKAAHLVGFKELQLLTRLAAHASSDDSTSQQQGHQQEMSERTACTPAKLIRLLLLSLPLRLRSGGAAARQQLTLTAIRGLLPAVARWRRRVTACHPSCMQAAREAKQLFLGLHAACCSLLANTDDLPCRAAACEVLLATELAACGCQVSEEEVETEVRAFALKQLAAFRRAEEADVTEEETSAEGSWLNCLLPGGSVNKKFLRNALPSLLGGDSSMGLSSLPGRQAAGDWRVGVALVLLCANLLKDGAGVSPEEQRPDADMHVHVLLLLVERHLNPPALSRPSSLPALAADPLIQQPQQVTDALGEEPRHEETKERGDTPGDAQQQQQQLLHLPASALQPLLHHVLYLLSDCSDLTLQQVALTVVRKAAVALGAAASAAATWRAAAQFAAEQQPATERGHSPDEEETDWSYAVCMQQQLMSILVPHLHRLLRSLEEYSQRMGLRALDALIRTLGPAGPLLPPAHASPVADLGQLPALFVSPEDEARRNTKLHLDLYKLLTPAKLTPAVEDAAALAQQLVAAGDARGAAAAAARAAQLEALAGELQASEREGGGDLFVDLLHMQKHRRARGLQQLTKAASSQQLCGSTLRHICLPLALAGVLQPNEETEAAVVKKRRGAVEKSLAATRQARGSRKRPEAFSQPMAEQGVECLAKCCMRLSLQTCVHTTRLLVSRLVGELPQREPYVHRAIAATLKAFPFGLTDAFQQTLSQPQPQMSARHQYSASGAAAISKQQQQDRAHKQPEETQDEGQADSSTAEEEDAETSAAASDAAAEKRRMKVAACIRDELIPMVYGLAFGTKVRRVSLKEGGGDAAVTATSSSGPESTKTFDNPVIRTELVAVIALLARRLPPREFHLQLPRLVRTLATSLRSRERSARRGSRTALVQLAVNLGPPYFAYLVTELQRMLGPRSEKDAAANQQSFLRPVLLFTVHAMLSGLLQQQRAAELEQPALLPETEETAAIDGTHFVQRFEAATPLLLPLITEEINRVADPDRLEQEESRRQLAARGGDDEEAGGVGRAPALAAGEEGGNRSKVEEAHTLKGPSLLLLLSRHTSVSGLEEHLLPFLIGLLSGAACKREGWCRGSAFSSRYVNRAEDLLLHFVIGLSRNTRVCLEQKLRTAKQLLILTVAALQFPLLHPLLQAERSFKASLYLLAQQQLMLLDRRQRVDEVSSRERRKAPQEEIKAGVSEGDAREAVDTKQQQQQQQATALYALSPSHQEDLDALGRLLLPGMPDKEEAAAASGLLQQASGTAAAPLLPHQRGDLASQHSRRLLVSLLKTRTQRKLTLQPGAVTGRSLAQATRGKAGGALGGMDVATQASLLGSAALRLLQLLVKGAKTELSRTRTQQLACGQPIALLAQSPKETAEGGRDGEADLRRCLTQLDETALQVVCCFSCKASKLVSWGARCLLVLLSLHLPELEKQGAFVAYLTMRVFHSCGSGSGLAGSDPLNSRSELLPICTKLMAVLLLQPQASKWLDTALNPSQHVGGDILRALLRKQLRVLPWRQQDRAQRQQGQKPQQPSRGGQAADLLQADLSFDVSLAVPDEQQREAAHFFLKEALLAHISSSLEDSQLQLCALFLFKRVVLQHYKDVAAAAARRAAAEDSPHQPPAAGAMDPRALQTHAQKKRRQRAAAEAAGEGAEAAGDEAGKDGRTFETTAAAELLPLVYECVDRVARVMVQHATSSPVSKKLSNICADVYVSFLLNFPMTPKLQQRRVFFLLQQQKFLDIAGRRAAIGALHKVVRRFPAELFLERYAQVALLTCCSTLATEADAAAHALLRDVVDEILQLAEVADDPVSALQGFLKTLAKVFLLPRAQHLSALLEFLRVFVDFASRQPSSSKRGLVAFLPAVLQLLSAASSLAAQLQEQEQHDQQQQHELTGGDWRLEYKSLLIFEGLLVAGVLPVLEEAFAQAVNVLREGGKAQLLGLAAAAAAAEATAVDAEETERQALQQSELTAFLTTIEVWDPSAPVQREKEKETRQKLAGANRQRLTQQQQQQIMMGLHAARLWRQVAGRGLLHGNAWVRCSALRSVSIYLQQTHMVGARPQERIPGWARLLLGGRRRSQEARPRSPSSPLTELGLSIGHHFGRDSILERHPYAAPCAVAALIGWATLAFTRPQLTPVIRKRRSGSRSKEQLSGGGSLRGRPPSPGLTRGMDGTAAESETEAFAQAAKGLRGNEAQANAEGGELSKAFAGETNEAAGEGQEETGVETEAQDALPLPLSPSLDDEGHAQEKDVGGDEAVDLVLQELQLEASKDDRETAASVSARTQQQPTLALSAVSWSVSSPSFQESSNPPGSAHEEEVHPLVFLTAGLNRWLRVHLGRLGYMGGTQQQQQQGEAAAGTVVRVAAILKFFGLLLKLLPLGELRRSSATPAAAATSAAAATPAAAAAAAACPSVSMEGVLLAALRHIADAAYRCSTLHAELAGESIVAQLMEDKTPQQQQQPEAGKQGAPAAAAGSQKGAAGDSQKQQHVCWTQLRGLSPTQQLQEVATGGAAVLRRLEQLLRSIGLEETHRVLLMETRQNVSARRTMRKLKKQQTFLENPQAHAQRKRRKNQLKCMQRKARIRQTILRRRGFVKRKTRIQ
ncbi:hypothetical protein ACSSS7_003839 [Eimeria intestinalis]